MEIKGAQVTLVPYTIQHCHEFYKRYVSDYDMRDDVFTYDEDWVNKYFNRLNNDMTWKLFAIIYNGEVIGEIMFKEIDYLNQHGTLGIHLANDEFKNRGLGTEAEHLLVQYGFNELGFISIYATAILRNKRSQHVLEKIGFVEVSEDDTLKYYKLDRDVYKAD